MQAAQRLFQDGHISYHRTDSTTLSDKALAESARAIRELFGDEYYTAPRRYATKVKNAQEAHEAIRPTNFGVAPRRSTAAGSRRPARLRADLEAHDGVADGRRARAADDDRNLRRPATTASTAVFTASGKAIEFAGFRRAYVEGSDDPAAELEEQETVAADARPSASASIATARAVQLVGARAEGARDEPAGALHRGVAHQGARADRHRPAVDLRGDDRHDRTARLRVPPGQGAGAELHGVRGHAPAARAFRRSVDVAFTAEMEEDLDQISRGEREWLDFIRQFYRGDRHHRGLEEAVKQAEERADYPLIDVGADPESGEPIRVRIGRYGPFLQLGEGGPGKTAALPPTLPPADLTVEKAMALIRAKAEGPRLLGVDPKTGMNVYAIHGRFGAYVQLGETPEKGVKEKPKRSSLTGGLTESTVTLDEALKLLELPRELGTHPESGQPIVAGLGRFGPYVKHGDDYRSLEATTISSPSISSGRSRCSRRRSARRARRQKRVIRKIEAPDGGTALQVLEGRYGPYVTDGETNASMPKGTDPADAVARRRARAARGAPRRAAVATPWPPAAAAAGAPARGRRRAPRPVEEGLAAPLPAVESEIHQGPGQGCVESEAEGRREARGPQARQLMGVRIVGGGLAGSEAAWQAASRGVRVTLYEMRPVRPTAVHKTDRLAELVCSNSFRGDKLDNAVGLLKEEMRRLGSLVMRAAEASRVPAGAALAVDRERFAETDHPGARRPSAHHHRPRRSHVDSRVERRRAGDRRDRSADLGGAVGADSRAVVGSDHLYFYDAISPIVLAETIDRAKVFRASRWDRSLRRGEVQAGPVQRAEVQRAEVQVHGAQVQGAACGVDDGQGDYLNCPLTRDEYERFYDALVDAESATVHDFDKERFFEGCLPIEVMAHRGRDTLRFGPMKPVGLVDPRTGREPYAAVQLRQDNLAGDHFSLVGFQTQIKWGDQARVLRLIPGLEQAEFVRFGMVHRNTYVNGPTVLRRDLAGARAADAVLRRPDVRRRRLRRVGGVGPARRAERGGAGARRAGVGAAAHDGDRRAGLLRVARQPGALRAVEHHVRDHGAAAIGRRAEEAAQRSAVGARARRSVRRGSMIEHLRAFLQFLALNRNASAHTVRAYESDLSQFLGYLAADAGLKKRDLQPAHLDRARDPRLSRRSCTSRGSRGRRRRASWPRCGRSSATCGVKG